MVTRFFRSRGIGVSTGKFIPPAPFEPDPGDIAPDAPTILQIWYDASVNTYLQPTGRTNGTTITQWNDRSAYAHNLNPDGGSWVSAGSTSPVEYNLAPGNITSGDHSYASFLISNNQSINTPQSAEFDFTEQLQRDPFTGTYYEYVLAAATTGTNIDVYASINWQEIT